MMKKKFVALGNFTDLLFVADFMSNILLYVLSKQYYQELTLVVPQVRLLTLLMFVVLCLLLWWLQMVTDVALIFPEK